MKPKLAKIKTVKTIRIVGHPCKECELNNPPIVCEGVVKEDGRVDWEVYKHLYRIHYCPFCGLELPKILGRKI